STGWRTTTTSKRSTRTSTSRTTCSRPWSRSTMDLDAAREFIRNNHRAVITTRRANGDPQLSPVVCGVDAGGRVAVSTRETAMKVKNLRRDPRTSLCVLNEEFFGDWIQVDGTADVVSLPAAMEL